MPKMKYWGVKFERELPAEFIITTHAEARMVERFHCDPEKMRKIVLKAWDSQETSNYVKMKVIKEALEGRKGTFRSFNGHVFIFETRWNKSLGYPQKILVTVLSRPHKYFSSL